MRVHGVHGALEKQSRFARVRRGERLDTPGIDLVRSVDEHDGLVAFATGVEVALVVAYEFSRIEIVVHPLLDNARVSAHVIEVLREVTSRHDEEAAFDLFELLRQECHLPIEGDVAAFHD